MVKKYKGLILFFLVGLIIVYFACGKKTQNNNPITEKKALDKDIKVTFIELGSTKCIPCKMMKPIIEEVKSEYANQVNVIFYDVWKPEGKPYGKKYKVRVIPTQVFLDKDGNEYFRHEGFFPKEDLIQVLKKKGVK